MSYSVGSKFFITRRDKRDPDHIYKSTNENSGNYTHHHHSIPQNLRKTMCID